MFDLLTAKEMLELEKKKLQYLELEYPKHLVDGVFEKTSLLLMDKYHTVEFPRPLLVIRSLLFNVSSIKRTKNPKILLVMIKIDSHRLGWFGDSSNYIRDKSNNIDGHLIIDGSKVDVKIIDDITQYTALMSDSNYDLAMYLNCSQDTMGMGVISTQYVFIHDARMMNVTYSLQSPKMYRPITTTAMLGYTTI